MPSRVRAVGSKPRTISAVRLRAMYCPLRTVGRWFDSRKENGRGTAQSLHRKPASQRTVARYIETVKNARRAVVLEE